MTESTTDISAELARFALMATATGAERTRGVSSLTAVVRRATCHAEHPTVTTALTALAAEGVGPVAAFGPAVDLSAPGAALLSAVAGSRPGDTAEQRMQVAVVAAASSAAHLLEVSGSDLVTAVTVGSEIGSRIVGALQTSSYGVRGWDVTGAGGSIGAAAAVARVAGMTPAATQQALGVAATQAAGLVLAETTSGWDLLVGKAAANGLEAALLCDAGFSGPPRGIEGRRGLFAVAAPDAEVSALIDALGQDWEILRLPELTAPEGSRDLSAEIADLAGNTLTLAEFVSSIRGAGAVSR